MAILKILLKKVNYLRAYTVGATAVALRVSRKWVDNVLSHHRVPGVLQVRQGIVRRVTPEGLLILEIAASLTRALGMPIPQSLEIARRLIAAKGGEVEIAGTNRIQLTADVDSIMNELNVRLEQAVEISPSPRRGRPAGK